MKFKKIVHAIALLSAISLAGWLYSCGGHADSDPKHADEAAHSSHSGEETKAHSNEEADTHKDEEPGAHSEEGEFEITAEAVKMAGITLTRAEIGKIRRSIDLSGEVGFNEDRLVHITPRFSGIAKEANFRVGDFVKEGDIVAVVESNESMTPYSLKAPISGRIIEKHILPGEHLSESESIYLLADLSTIWVNLSVYPKDASSVKQGQKAIVSEVGTDHEAMGTIQYVTPVMNAETRKMTARMVLQNSNNEWKPGTFVNAHIETKEGREGLVIDKKAVQILEGKTVVFVSDEPNRFKPVEVATGESDSRNIQILSGLEPGIQYVNSGAFELKAKIVTSSLGGHAGHGH